MKKFSFYKGDSTFWYLIILGLSLSHTPVLANKLLRQLQSLPQEIQISGTITDGTSPLPGVTVTIKGKATTGTISDFDGNYTLRALPNDTLVVAFMGYKTVSEPVNGRKIINIQLQENITSLQEVRVNAGYYSVKEKERTGSIARITAKEIETQPVTNVLAAMQGRMAGVNITQTTGVPGGGFDIQIRGLNSVRTDGNDPLYIIDGVPYATEAIGSGQNSTVLPGRPSPLNSINPDQVESIEVLKDADATAIYGSRGANGVVLITTKKGKAGKTRFNTKLSNGVVTVSKFMDLLDTEQYLAMRNEAIANDGFTEAPEYAYDINGSWDENRYTNWQKELIGRTAEYSELQASVSGGSAQTQYLMSVGYNKQTTVFPGDWHYKKGNVHLSMNHESDNKRFRSTFSAGYTFQNNLQPRTDPSITALTLVPNAPALRDAGGILNWEGSTWNNPMADLIPEYEAKTYDLIANSVFSYALGKGFEIKSSFGYTATNNDEVTVLPSTRFDPSGGFGPESSQIIVGRYAKQSWIIEPQLNWSKTFGSNRMEVLLGSSFQSQHSEQLVQFGTGFSSNSLIYNLASANTVNIFSSTAQEYRYQAFFGRVNLNWHQKYIINLTGRHDGSSRFGPGKKYAHFGAVGVAWLFSNEKLLEDNSILSFGKLRSSYGITGNDQIGDYQYLDTYASSNINYNGTIGLQPVRLYNPDFGWETNTKFEAALELGFLKDRIFLTAGYYRNVSSNQLTDMPLPATTGFTSMIVNLDAVVENTGIEFTFRTVNVQRNKFSWTTNFNLTSSRNRLLEFPNLDSSTYRNRYVIGESLSIMKVYHFTGVDPDTGLYTFEDKNGDGVLSAAGDKQYVKDFSPEFYGGLQNQFQYRRWQLSFLLQFVKQENYNENLFFGIPGTMTQQPLSALNRWQHPDDSATHQMYTEGTNGAAVEAFDHYYNSDATITNASFVRLKNVSLSYDLPEGLIKNMQCKVFAEGQNLLTFTNYKGPDPEFKAAGYLPPLRVISAGVQFSF